MGGKVDNLGELLNIVLVQIKDTLMTSVQNCPCFVFRIHPRQTQETTNVLLRTSGAMTTQPLLWVDMRAYLKILTLLIIYFLFCILIFVTIQSFKNRRSINSCIYLSKAIFLHRKITIQNST